MMDPTAGNFQEPYHHSLTGHLIIQILVPH